MPVTLECKTVADTVLALWDLASTVSLILNSTDKISQLPGRPVSVVIETLGCVSLRFCRFFPDIFRQSYEIFHFLEASFSAFLFYSFSRCPHTSNCRIMSKQVVFGTSRVLEIPQIELPCLKILLTFCSVSNCSLASLDKFKKLILSSWFLVLFVLTLFFTDVSMHERSLSTIDEL